MQFRVRELRHYVRIVLALSVLTACGQTNGCSGCDAQGDGEPFPDKDKVHSAVQVRLTRHGLDFLEENLTPLLEQAIPADSLSVCLPGDGGNVIGVQWGYCVAEPCADGSGGNGCNINVEIGGVDLEARPPNVLQANVQFSALSVRIDVAVDPVVSCTLAIDGPGFVVGVPLTLSTPEPTRELTFTLAEGPQYNLADLDIHLINGGGFFGWACDVVDGAINFPFIGDLILGGLQGLLEGPLLDGINGFVQDFTCRTCTVVGDCPDVDGVACTDGRCIANDVCLPQPLGVEGLIDVGDLLGGVSPGLSAEINYHAVPGSYVAVEGGGLSLGVIAGAISDRNRCVPARPQPDVFEPARTPLLRGNVDPNDNEYEVGVGITDQIIGHFMWAAFNAGVLCLQITSDTVPQLSAGTLGIALPNLGTLTRNPQAPIGITLSPQEVPRVTIGANTFIEDADGNPQLDDPLLTIVIPDLWLDFHTFMDDRWVRIFSLHADVTLPIGIAFTPDNGIVPIIGDLGHALSNVRTANGEIMRDDPAVLAGLLPTILNAFVGDLANGLIDPIQLPDIMGFQLDLQDGAITGIEMNTMLAVFARLQRAPEAGAGAAYAVETEAEVLDVNIPPTEDFAIEGPDTWRRPYVVLGLDAWDGTGEQALMEFSWKVGGSSWTPFTQRREVIVRNPQFLLQGKHHILVRARRVDDYRTLDPTPVELTVVIDSQAPTVRLSEKADGYAVAVEDLVSDADALFLEVRQGDGPWQPLDRRLVRPDEGVSELRVRATDEAGNVGEARVSVQRAGLIGRLPPDAEGGGGGCGGCNVGERPPVGGTLWLLAAPLLLGLRRRRRWSLVLLALLALIGCDDSAASGDGPVPDAGLRPDAGGCRDEDCERGQVCRDGACTPLTCTDDPSVCNALDCGAAGSTCTAGRCECLPFCPEGCGEGEYCCEQRNACEAEPEPECGEGGAC
ncbi:MAG: hypothetical protein KC620_10635, partial [Myxococcales bacterium]|nr:hypothetical protein [Myxococcales bacterium]